MRPVARDRWRDTQAPPGHSWPRTGQRPMCKGAPAPAQPGASQAKCTGRAADTQPPRRAAERDPEGARRAGARSAAGHAGWRPCGGATARARRYGVRRPKRRPGSGGQSPRPRPRSGTRVGTGDPGSPRSAPAMRGAVSSPQDRKPTVPSWARAGTRRVPERERGAAGDTAPLGAEQSVGRPAR